MMRCLAIRPGAPICEYVGVLRTTEEVDGLLQNNYIFDIDCLQTMKGLDGREKRAGSDMHMPSLHAENDSEAPPAPEYCIDVGSVGSFARFINHSCNPNLFVQCVLTNHHDVKLAKELCYDYGYVLNSVVSADGEIVKLPCYCGAPDCQKRLYRRISSVWVLEEAGLYVVLGVAPDIDSCDVGNSLAVVEYVDEIYNFYRRTEELSCVSPTYMTHQTDINENMRGILFAVF